MVNGQTQLSLVKWKHQNMRNSKEIPIWAQISNQFVLWQNASEPNIETFFDLHETQKSSETHGQCPNPTCADQMKMSKHEKSQFQHQFLSWQCVLKTDCFLHSPCKSNWKSNEAHDKCPNQLMLFKWFLLNTEKSHAAPTSDSNSSLTTKWCFRTTKCWTIEPWKVWHSTSF